MLQSLSIHNYQCHHKLVIEFDPCITIIIGESDRGKSAVLRALRWLCLNRPSGTSFLRHGTGKVSVRLRVDGHILVRHRGRGTNTYVVDRQSYRALGRDLPTAVAGILNVSDDNFQQQHAAAYWLTDSPGQVARNLNRIVNLSLIDRTLGNIAAVLRKARTAVEVSKDRLEQARQQRNGLSWCTAADAKLQAIEALQVQIEENRSRHVRIASLVAEAARIDLLLQNAAAWQQTAAAAKAVAVELAASRERLGLLRGLLVGIEQWQEQIRQTHVAITSIREEMASILGKRCPLCHQPIRITK